MNDEADGNGEADSRDCTLFMPFTSDWPQVPADALRITEVARENQELCAKSHLPLYLTCSNSSCKRFRTYLSEEQATEAGWVFRPLLCLQCAQESKLKP